jgi:hypothetical protein
MAIDGHAHLIEIDEVSRTLGESILFDSPPARKLLGL